MTSKQVQVQADFEEIVSTHNGCMVHLDNEAVLFAEPEDAAEYDLDLQPVELRVTVRGDAHLACLERARRTLIRSGWQVEF